MASAFATEGVACSTDSAERPKLALSSQYAIRGLAENSTSLKEISRGGAGIPRAASIGFGSFTSATTRKYRVEGSIEGELAPPGFRIRGHGNSDGIAITSVHQLRAINIPGACRHMGMGVRHGDIAFRKAIRHHGEIGVVGIHWSRWR